MTASFVKRLLRPGRDGKRTRRGSRSRELCRFEALEERQLLAVTASFNPAFGLLTILGDAQPNTITVSRNAAGSIRVNGGAVQIIGGTPTVANTALIQAFGQGGNDTIALDETNGALPRANLFGGTGNDTLIGGSGADMLFGQAGNDTLLGKGGIDFLFGGADDDVLTGGDGNDQVFGESGNDRMIWNPGDDTDLNEGGDGSDTVEVNGAGGAGTDTLLLGGSNVGEIFDVSANGERVRFTRNVGNIGMDLNDLEAINLNALGGTDTVTVGDLSGTDLVQMNVNLAGVLGGGAGDAQPDLVIVNGTNGDDVIDVFGAGTSVSVVGLSAQVNVANSEGTMDSLVVNALGGADGVTATTLPAGVVKLTVDGGTGDDSLLGSQGPDVLLGGDGDDFILGDNGNDLALMGADDDVFQWNPGDGSDTVEGQDGADTLLFFGSGAGENIDILANGGRVLFLRNVGNVTWTSTTSSASTSTRWAAPIPSSSATSPAPT